VILATFSGDAVLSGTQRALGILVQRARTAFLAAPTPSSAALGATVTLRAWHLPGRATGKVVFSAGPNRLCVAHVRSGGGTCTFVLHLAAGLHPVVARYVGDRDFGASLARTTLEARPAVGPAPSAGWRRSPTRRRRSVAS
jgi:Bacterial Ig-like domain (group 3)